MDRWFSSPKIFDHLWGCKTKAVGTVMPKQKKKHLNEHFSGEMKKGEKYHVNGITSWPSSGRTNTTADRFLGRDHSIYSVPATHSKLAAKSQHSFLASAEDASDCESCEGVLQYTAENAM
jgi:hypothetical protein